MYYFMHALIRPLELVIPLLELFIRPLELCSGALEHHMLVKRTTSCKPGCDDLLGWDSTPFGPFKI